MFQSLPAENVALGTTIEQSCIKLNHDNLRTISGNPGDTVVPAPPAAVSASDPLGRRGRFYAAMPRAQSGHEKRPNRNCWALVGVQLRRYRLCLVTGQPTGGTAGLLPIAHVPAS